MRKPASLELTEKSAKYLVEVLNKLYSGNYEISDGLEAGSFDLDLNDEFCDGGAYIVDEDGNIMIVSIFNLPLGDEIVGNGIDRDVSFTKSAYRKLDNR